MMENQTRPYNSAESMNKALSSLYESKLPEIYEQIGRCAEQCGWEADKVSAPFFMQVDEAYLQAPVKILFVGRETYGWAKYDRLQDVNALMDYYKTSYDVGKHHNSPFWWFRKDFSRAMDIGENFMKATLWTNLSKIDTSKKRPTGKQFGHLSQVFIKLLVEEIAIVKPDVVIIMTRDGHYTWHLNNYRWIQNDLFKDSNDELQLKRESILPNKTDRLIAENRLPTYTYQVCHPRALCGNKDGGYKKQADEIIRAIVHQISL